MKPFEEWVQDLAKTPIKIHYIPDNVWSDDGGATYFTECYVCGKTDAVDPEWFTAEEADGEYQHYCGGSPRCCP